MPKSGFHQEGGTIISIASPQPVRDLWQRKDLGRFASGFAVPVPAHGTVLIKVGQPSQTD